MIQPSQRFDHLAPLPGEAASGLRAIASVASTALARLQRRVSAIA